MFFVRLVFGLIDPMHTNERREKIAPTKVFSLIKGPRNVQTRKAEIF